MATITYTVTVASGTTQYGTGNRFYINGELVPALYLDEGSTYIFDLSDTTNDTHQLAFSTNPNNSPAASYTTGVTSTGTPGTSGAKTTIVVAPVKKTGAPVLFYYCTAHSGMGNSIQTISPTSNEAEFNPQIDDIIEFSDYKKGKEILKKYNVDNPDPKLKTSANKQIKQLAQKAEQYIQTQKGLKTDLMGNVDIFCNENLLGSEHISITSGISIITRIKTNSNLTLSTCVVVNNATVMNSIYNSIINNYLRAPTDEMLDYWWQKETLLFLENVNYEII